MCASPTETTGRTGLLCSLSMPTIIKRTAAAVEDEYRTFFLFFSCCNRPQRTAHNHCDKASCSGKNPPFSFCPSSVPPILSVARQSVGAPGVLDLLDPISSIQFPLNSWSLFFLPPFHSIHGSRLWIIPHLPGFCVRAFLYNHSQHQSMTLRLPSALQSHGHGPPSTQTTSQQHDLAPNGLINTTAIRPPTVSQLKIRISEIYHFRQALSSPWSTGPSRHREFSSENAKPGWVRGQAALRAWSWHASASKIDGPSRGCLAASPPCCLVASLPRCFEPRTLSRGLASGRRLNCSPNRPCLKRGGSHDDTCIFRSIFSYRSGEIPLFCPPHFSSTPLSCRPRDCASFRHF